MMYALYSTQKNGNTISGLVGDDHHDVYAVFYIKEWQHDIRLYLVMQSHVTFPLNCWRYNYKTFFPQFTDVSATSNISNKSGPTELKLCTFTAVYILMTMAVFFWYKVARELKL